MSNLSLFLYLFRPSKIQVKEQQVNGGETTEQKQLLQDGLGPGQTKGSNRADNNCAQRLCCSDHLHKDRADKHCHPS
jgi:hypothetical protein